MLDNNTLDRIEALYGPIPKAVSRLIRPALHAPADHTLVWGDWSAIEARMLPWLAGGPGEVVLDVFRQNDADPELPDIYKIEASGIFDVNAVDVDKEQRQIGKVAILALGFGGGEGALDAMAANYGVHLSPELRKFIVTRWRTNNPWATDFWDKLNRAFFEAWDTPGKVCPAGRVAYVFNPDYLRGTMFCYLPCGRPLTYAALRREKVKFEDEATGEEVEDWKVRYQKGYTRGSIWHGILAENITQGAAASLLRDLLTRLDRDSFAHMPVVGHTHDEAITRPLMANADTAQRELKMLMETPPAWASGLPLAAEVSENWYYTKTID